MKKIFTFLFLSVLALNLMAQDEDHKITVNANAGFTLWNVIAKPLFDLAEDAASTTTDVSVDGMVLPSFGANFDYGLTKVVVIGLGLSYQPISLSYKDNVSSMDVSINRLNVGLRTSFHYANEGPFDLYSGFRIGYKLTTTNVSGNSQDFGFDETTFDPIFPLSFQIIAFGMRYYVVENIGLGLEFALGNPHFAAFGASFRF